MRTKLIPLLTMLLLVLTTSCNFTETITINEDGSGVVNIQMDGSQIMAMAGEEIAKEGKEERIDSIMSFKDLFADKKDSIAKLPKEQQELLKKLEKVEVRIVMDTKTSEFKLDMMNKFTKANEIGDMMKVMNELQNKNKKGSGAGSTGGMMDNKSDVSYSYDGKKFSRKVVLQKEMEKIPDSLAMYVEIFESSNYVLSYKFPKKIKSVSNKSAVISEDKRSLTLAYSFSDYITDPKSMNLEVTFEK